MIRFALILALLLGSYVEATTIVALRVNAPTASGGTVDVTYPGIGNAAAAIVFGNHVESSELGTSVDESKHSLGFWTPAAQCVFSSYNKDGRATGNGLTGHREKAGSSFMLLNDADTGIKTEFIASAITDGVRLTRVSAGTDTPMINVLLIGEGAEASLQTPVIADVEGNGVTGSLPFARPDCVITAMTSDQLDNSSTHGGTNHFSIGFLSLLPGRTEMATFTSAEASDHASTGAENLVGVPGASWGGVSTQHTIVCSDPSRNIANGFDWIVDLVMTSDSAYQVTTTRRGSDTSAPEIAALFLKIPDHFVRVGLLTTPTSTGTASATLSNPPTGTASAILVAQSTCIAANTELTASGVPTGVGLGVYTSANGQELSLNRRSQANISPSVTASEQHSTLLNVNRHNAASGFTASVESVSQGVVNIDATRVYTSAFVMPYLIFEPNGFVDNSLLLATLEARHDTTDTNFTDIKGSGFDADDSLQSINLRTEQIDGGIDQLKGDDETYNPSLHGLTVLKATADALPTEAEIVAAASGSVEATKVGSNYTWKINRRRQSTRSSDTITVTQGYSGPLAFSYGKALNPNAAIGTPASVTIDDETDLISNLRKSADGEQAIFDIAVPDDHPKGIYEVRMVVTTTDSVNLPLIGTLEVD